MRFLRDGVIIDIDIDIDDIIESCARSEEFGGRECAFVSAVPDYGCFGDDG
jgi:hypothetical protein